jgi:hypothetical protein
LYTPVNQAALPRWALPLWGLLVRVVEEEVVEPVVAGVDF